MKILVTGSKGFLGNHLIDFFCKNNIKTISFDLGDGQDLLDKEALEKAISLANYIIHLAAVGDVYKAAEDPTEAAISGVAGTANLVFVANKHLVKKIIYISTWEVYGKPEYQPIDENHPCLPDHPYSISKYGGELMIRSKLNKTPWIILRLGSAYGLNMRPNAVIPLFINKALRGEKIVLDGGGYQTRQFTHIEDITLAFHRSITLPIKNEVFNIVTPEVVTIREIADFIKKRIPAEVIVGKKRLGDVQSARISSEKARKVLQWEAKIKFRDGLDAIINSLT